MPVNNNVAKNLAAMSSLTQTERVKPEPLPVGTILGNRFKLVELTLEHPTLGLNYNAINQQGEGFVIKMDAEVNLMSFVRSEGGFLQAVSKINVCDLFVEIVHSAKWQSYIYFATRFRPGPSINECWSSMPSGKFSPGTAARIAHQYIKAIEVVHSLGYLLRRVDPNVIKFDASTRQIYLSDLSSTRLDPAKAKMAIPVKWAGAGLYAPLQHHQGKTHLQRHDLEPVLYLLVEMTMGKLPWEGTPPDMLGSAKRSAVTSQSLFKGCPSQYASLHTVVTLLGDSDRIEYSQLYTALAEVWQAAGIKCLEEPFEWEAHMKPYEEPTDS